MRIIALDFDPVIHRKYIRRFWLRQGCGGSL
jgi:hypothetical protein